MSQPRKPRKGEGRIRVADAGALGSNDACSVCGRSAVRVDGLGRCRLPRCRRAQPVARPVPEPLLRECVHCDRPLARLAERPPSIAAALRALACADCRRRRHDPDDAVQP